MDLTVRRPFRHADWSAYGGPGWQPRVSTHAEDVQGSRSWRQCGENSEWARLREVALFIPTDAMEMPDDPNEVQCLERIDFGVLRRQLEGFAKALDRQGVVVHRIKDRSFDYHDRTAGAPPFNLMYASDLILPTTEGIIVGRMASRIRAGEEKYIARLAADLGMPILATIGGAATFEASDAVWIAPDLVFVGIGYRTNAAGFRQLRRILKPLGIAAQAVPLPRHGQHLRGILRLIDASTAIVRSEVAPPSLRRKLRQRGITAVEVPESHAVRYGQIINFIVVDARTILTCQTDNSVDELFREAGIQVCDIVDVSELLKGAGGLACATATIRRDLV